MTNRHHTLLRCKRSTILFFAAYDLLIIYRILKSSTMGFDDHGITYIIAAFLFAAHIITLKVKLPELALAVASFGVVVLYVLRTSDPVIPVVLLALIASKNIEWNEIIDHSFCIMLPLVVMIVLLAVAGVLNDTLSWRTFLGAKVACHGAGFNHSSALPTYYCFLFLEYCYRKNRKVRFTELIGWLIGGYIIYRFCGERLRFYMLFIIAALILAEPIFVKYLLRLRRAAMTLIYPVLTVVSLFIGYIYDQTNAWMYALNLLVSNRLYFEHYAFQHYSIPLFGQSISMGENALVSNGNSAYFYIDSAYVYLFFVYGIVIALAILVIYTKGARMAERSGSYMMMVWFFVMAIDGMIGNQMLSVWSAPILFFAFCRKTDFGYI